MSNPQSRPLLALVISLPLSLLCRHVRAATSRHFYLAATGFALSLFLYGWVGTFHLAAMVLYSLATLRMASPRIAPAIVTAISFSHLLYGHWSSYNYEGNYHLCWTISGMIVLPKVCNMAWTFSDLHTSGKLTDKPTLLEGFGYGFCLCGFVCSPMSSFSEYTDFVNNKGKFVNGTPSALKAYETKWRLLWSAVGLGIVVVFGQKYTDTLLESPVFVSQHSLLSRILYMFFINFVCNCKYFVGWWIAELSCIFSGLSFSGNDEMGTPQWNSCRAISVVPFYCARSVKGLVRNWNNSIQQNFHYYSCFSRLRYFLPKKCAAPMTFMMSSIWHGLYPGYYIFSASVIMLDFSATYMENQLAPVTKKSPFLSSCLNILMWCYIQTIAAYCMIPIRTLTLVTAYNCMKSVGFFGHWMMIAALSGSLLISCRSMKPEKAIVNLSRQG